MGGRGAPGAGATHAAPSEHRAPRPGWPLVARALRAQRGGIALGVLAGLAWTAGKVAVPALVRGAIDHGIAGGSRVALVQWSLGIAAAGVVAAIFTGLRRYMAFREARRLELGLRDRMFAHIQRLHFGYHDRTQTGQLMSRANTDLGAVQNLVSLVPLTLSNLATVIAVTAIMLVDHVLLTLCALGSLPLINVLGRRFSERLFPAMRALQEESAQLASVVEESVAGARVVKGFGAEDVQRGRLAKEADDVYAVAMRAAAVRSRFAPAIDLLPGVGLLCVLGYGGHLVLAGSLTQGSFVMFFFYVLLLVNPLRMLGQLIAQAERAGAAADRVAAVLATEPAIVDPARPARLAGARPRGEVRFEGVRFRYGERGARLLDGFDLSLKAGETVALVGATGSGKSTIARLLPRYYDVEHGRVLLDGVDVREFALADLRRWIGIVFEDTFLFSDSVAGNIAFANPDASHEAIERAARLAGAHEFIAELPGGYDTLLGERGYSLSGGQRQRIALARAILCDPSVLILDDATSSVDPTKEQEIRAALAEVTRGRTTLVIAHRPATIALADRVVFLDGGRIVAEGTHADLLATSAAYRRVLAAGETRPTGAVGEVARA